MKKNVFSSFDGGSQAVGYVSFPDRYRYWPDLDSKIIRISAGSGLSNAPASFKSNMLSISHAKFNRILSFDEKKCEIEVEAGSTLFDIFGILAQKGYYLKIQPGYSFVSIGGCIAANVHGKNQAEDGCFKEQVVSLKLFHPQHGIIKASPKTNKDVFDLTCGGYGLTGHILSAKLKIKKKNFSAISSSVVQFNSFHDGVNKLRNEARNCDFIYTWFDFAFNSKGFGNGLLYKSHFDKNREGSHFNTTKKSNKKISFTPFNLYNKHTINFLNKSYKLKEIYLHKTHQTFFETLFPLQKTMTYYSLFGPSGFCEYQVIIPHSSIGEFFNELRSYIIKNEIIITLASSKLFSGAPQYLYFQKDGISLALNFPRNSKSYNFLNFLDELTMKYMCIPNIIKDSRLEFKVVKYCYENFESFRNNLKVFDPQRLFRSVMSDRLFL